MKAINSQLHVDSVTESQLLNWRSEVVRCNDKSKLGSKEAEESGGSRGGGSSMTADLNLLY